MFDAMDDPLGISLRERARDRRREMENTQLAAGGRPMAPGLSGPWDAWFQAMDEAGVDELADTSVGMRGRNRRGEATLPPSLYALLNEEQGRSF